MNPKEIIEFVDYLLDAETVDGRMRGEQLNSTSKARLMSIRNRALVQWLKETEQTFKTKASA